MLEFGYVALNVSRLSFNSIRQGNVPEGTLGSLGRMIYGFVEHGNDIICLVHS